MASLKSFLPVLAPILATTPDALYSRQRALVNLGLLEPHPGRGPGSGVELSADSVATLVISALAADTLAETDGRVALICNATAREKMAGVETARRAQGTFRHAVARCIEAGHLATPSLWAIRVSKCWAQIQTSGPVVDYYLPDDHPADGPIVKTSEIRITVCHKIMTAFSEQTGKPARLVKYSF